MIGYGIAVRDLVVRYGRRNPVTDYGENPRTVILSSHLIGEVENALSGVTILDRGTVALTDDVDAVRR